MKITGFKSLKTIHNWQRPIGDVNGSIESGITEIPILILETDSGLSGIGIGAHKDINFLFSAIENEDPRAVNSLYDRMLSVAFKSGHCGAIFSSIGCIDMALWDLKAKIAGEPLWKTLGARNNYVKGYASGLDFSLSIEQLLTLHEKFEERGFTSFKLKGGLNVNDDLERLAVLQSLYRKNTAHPVIMIDVNESMTRKQAIKYINRIEEQFSLAWIEEPVRRWDVEGHALITSSTNVAVATGENLTGLEQFTQLFKNNALDIVQTGMCWGITHFLRVATCAQMFNLPISPVGYNTNPVAHAAAAISNHLCTKIQDIAFPEGLIVDQSIDNGGIIFGDSAGLGITVDESKINSGDDKYAWTKTDGPHVRPTQAGLRLILENDQ